MPRGLAFFALPMPKWLGHATASVFLHQVAGGGGQGAAAAAGGGRGEGAGAGGGRGGGAGAGLVMWLMCVGLVGRWVWWGWWRWRWLCWWRGACMR